VLVCGTGGHIHAYTCFSSQRLFQNRQSED
jgi:hypothetical protein